MQLSGDMEITAPVRLLTPILSFLSTSVLDSLLYRNVAAAIMRMGLSSPFDRATLLAMLFVETVCLGDLRQAASDVEAASKKIMGASFRAS